MLDIVILLETRILLRLHEVSGRTFLVVAKPIFICLAYGPALMIMPSGVGAVDHA